MLIWFMIWIPLVMLLVIFIMSISPVYRNDLSFCIFVLIIRMKILIDYVQNLYSGLILYHLQGLSLSLSTEVKERFCFTLSSNQIQEVDSVLTRGDESQLYSSKGGYSIYLRDLRTLQDRRWLNDNVLSLGILDHRLLIAVYSQQKNWLLNVVIIRESDCQDQSRSTVLTVFSLRSSQKMVIRPFNDGQRKSISLAKVVLLFQLIRIMYFIEQRYHCRHIGPQL